MSSPQAQPQALPEYSLPKPSSGNNLGMDHPRSPVIDHGDLSANLPASMSTPEVTGGSLSPVLSSHTTPSESGSMDPGFCEECGAPRERSSLSRAGATSTSEDSKPNTLRSMKVKLDEYNETMTRVIEENNHLKTSNHSIQQKLTTVQARIQELEADVAVRVNQHQHQLDQRRTDKDRIRLLTDQVIQLERFNQSLVSLDFNQHPVIARASADVARGVNSDDALIDAILHASSQSDTPWSRIYSCLEKYRAAFPRQTRKHDSISSNADTASTTSSQAYRHDAPPVLNDLIASFKSGAYTSTKGSQVLWADVCQHHVRDATAKYPRPPRTTPVAAALTKREVACESKEVDTSSIKSEEMSTVHHEFQSTSSLDIHETLKSQPQQPLIAITSTSKIDEDNTEHMLLAPTSMHNETAESGNYLESHIDSSPSLTSYSSSPLVEKINALIPPSRVNNPISPLAHANARTVSYIKSLRSNPVRNSIITPSSSVSSIPSLAEETIPLPPPVNKQLRERRGSIGSPPTSPLPTPAPRAKPFVPSKRAPVILALRSLSIKPTVESSTVEPAENYVSPQTTPPSPSFRRRIFSKSSKKQPSSPTVPCDTEQSSPSTSNGASSSSLLKKRFGSSGNIKAPRLKLPFDKSSPSSSSPGPSSPSVGHSSGTDSKSTSDLSPPSTTSSTFGIHTRKFSQMTANFMSSVESMIHSSKSSSSTLSPPVSPTISSSLGPKSISSSSSATSSSPMSSMVSSPSPSPHTSSSPTLLSSSSSPYADTSTSFTSAASSSSTPGSPSSGPQPALATSYSRSSDSHTHSSSHQITASVAPSRPAHLSHIPWHPDIDVPEVVKSMTFPIKWETYKPKPFADEPPTNHNVPAADKEDEQEVKSNTSASALAIAQAGSTLYGTSLPGGSGSVTGKAKEEVAVSSSDARPQTNGQDRQAPSPIDYRNSAALAALDISQEKLDEQVYRLVSTFSSSSLGSLDDSDSDCETLRERAREHLDNPPRDLCELEHIQKALIEEERYKAGRALDQTSRESSTEKGESGDLTLLSAPPLGSPGLSPPSSPSAKAVTWGGISVQNISSSETSSITSSSSFGSVTSPILPVDTKKSLPVAKSSTIPTSILKKSALPLKSSSRVVSSDQAKFSVRTTTKRLTPPALPMLPRPSGSSPPKPPPTHDMYEGRALASEFSSNSRFTYAATSVSPSQSGPSSVPSDHHGAPASGESSGASVSFGSQASVHSGVPIRKDVIPRSTVGPTAKRLSSGTLAAKRSALRMPVTVPSTIQTPQSPPSSSFQTKHSFTPGRQCPDSSRSFLAVPSRKTRSTTVSSPATPNLCTPSPESSLASSSKARSNTVPYSPTTRSPLSQHVVTAPASGDQRPPITSTAPSYREIGKPSIEQRLPIRQRQQTIPPPRKRTEPPPPLPTSRIAKRMSPPDVSRDLPRSGLPVPQQRRAIGNHVPLSLIPTVTEQSPSLSASQYRRLFRGTINMVVR